MRYRVVLDTNVIFSAIGWRGKPRDCLELARTQAIQGLICQHILDELLEKLITKMHLTLDEASVVIDELLVFMEIVEIMGALQGVCGDPNDDAVLECALKGQATHLVTGDTKHLLPLKRFEGIEIVSPAEFLQIIQREK